MTVTFIGAEHMNGVCSFGSLTGGQVDELPLKKKIFIQSFQQKVDAQGLEIIRFENFSVNEDECSLKHPVLSSMQYGIEVPHEKERCTIT